MPHGEVGQVATPIGMRWSSSGPRWAWLVTIVALLALAWAVTDTAGGTRTAWPHLFYAPIVLAALPFGLIGGVVAGLAAALLCGPLMPLDTATGAEQSLSNWLTRGGFFVGIGLLSGLTMRALRRSVEAHLVDHLRLELDRATRPEPASVPSDMAARIRATITERRFHPVYQPIYALPGGRLTAVEALTRFDPEPVQPPNVWFDQASRAGMGVALDLATIERALQDAQTLAEDIQLHLNVTPPTMRDPRLLELFAQYPHRRVVVEITEHAVIDDYDRLELARKHLRDHGVQLAVDDAGAGFASLRHIVRLAPEIIKLDISLTRDLHADPIRRALAGSLVDFATKTGIHLIAEGIETPNDLAQWKKLGAHAAQGYLLARPGPLHAVAATDTGQPLASTSPR